MNYILEICLLSVIVFVIILWLTIKTCNDDDDNYEHMDSVPKQAIPQPKDVSKFDLYRGHYQDLRGFTLPTRHAYSRYAGDGLYNVVSDTGVLRWSSDVDPRSYMSCDVTNCPNSRDDTFANDLCLNCN
ncbi:hypothetical protein Hokovirus_3_222 [Hokovirus HKV1]|uniref:Uncharacterized protein n=1 Tax=Hokovirus HKV1 TaxID=1977638 RepID=A0A1V0SGV0_9VIRU|nr:hypothetical protein Hokovirus_3_222 [Hokovirus HKV1]